MAIAFQSIQTATQTSTHSSISITSNVASSDTLYLAVANLYGDSSSTPSTVTSVSGGSGLTWARVKAGCSGRIQNPYSEMWWAYGSPGSNFTVTMTYSDADVRRSSAAVARYTGTAATIPSGAAYENTNGLTGTCGGGTDNALANIDITSTVNNSVHFILCHPRNTDVDIPDSEYTERANIINSSGGDGANLYLSEKLLATAGTDNCENDLNSDKPWIMVGCAIEPATAVGSKIQMMV